MKITDKKLRNNIIQKTGIFILFISLAYLFALKSPLNIWESGESGTDSSVFRNVAFLMGKGYMPYKDTFDHKGPLIYLLNFIGMHISYYKGIWMIELLTLFITFLFLYKISRLYCGKLSSIIIVLISSMLLFDFYNCGNLTEEYAMPFIAISLYIFIDYFKNNKITIFRLIVCGFSFGAVCMLRLNMISVWIIFCIAVLMLCIQKREFFSLKQFIGYFILGACIIILPIMLWLIRNDAFSSFLKDYIAFNMIYVSPEGGRASHIAKWNSFFVFLNNDLILAILMLSVFRFFTKKELLSGVYILYLLLTILLMCMSGKMYSHYGMILVPAAVFPISSFYEMFKAEQKQTKNLAVILIVVSLLSTIVLPDWINLLRDAGTIYADRNTEHLSEPVTEVCNYITSHTNPEDPISVYGNWDIIYVLTQRISASKYSYQFPIGTVVPSIMDEYFSELQEKKPKIIIINREQIDERMNQFLTENDYKTPFENTVIWVLSEEFSKN